MKRGSPANGLFSALKTRQRQAGASRRPPCYSCHAEHAAVDTTFVQFYPTLLPIAKGKGTLSPAYLKETTPPPAK